jgi:hypothetical protein
MSEDGSGVTTVKNLDLTEEEPQAPAQPLQERVLQRRTIHSDDWARVTLALVLVGLLVILTVGAGLYVATWPEKKQAIEMFLKLVFAPVIALVGSVVGFYFGSRVGR